MANTVVKWDDLERSEKIIPFGRTTADYSRWLLRVDALIAATGYAQSLRDLPETPDLDTRTCFDEGMTPEDFMANNFVMFLGDVMGQDKAAAFLGLNEPADDDWDEFTFGGDEDNILGAW